MTKAQLETIINDLDTRINSAKTEAELSKIAIEISNRVRSVLLIKDQALADWFGSELNKLTEKVRVKNAELKSAQQRDKNTRNEVNIPADYSKKGHYSIGDMLLHGGGGVVSAGRGVMNLIGRMGDESYGIVAKDGKTGIPTSSQIKNANFGQLQRWTEQLIAAGAQRGRGTNPADHALDQIGVAINSLASAYNKDQATKVRDQSLGIKEPDAQQQAPSTATVYANLPPDRAWVKKVEDTIKAGGGKVTLEDAQTLVNEYNTNRAIWSNLQHIRNAYTALYKALGGK